MQNPATLILLFMWHLEKSVEEYVMIVNTTRQEGTVRNVRNISTRILTEISEIQKFVNVSNSIVFLIKIKKGIKEIILSEFLLGS